MKPMITMRPMMNARRSILMTLVAGTTLVTASAAFAQVYGAPPPPQPRFEESAPARAPGVAVTLGWHGERYWDGQRYWAHDEWMHRHPHERDPRRDREREHEHEHREY